jgi:hypothetical protein
MLFDLKNILIVQLDCLVLIYYLNQKEGFLNLENGKVLSQLGIKCYFFISDDIDMQFGFCKIC